MFKRESVNGGKILIGEWATPEFGWLQDNKWVWTEKIDGTSILIHFDGEKITFGGHTVNSQIPFALVEKLHELFDSKLQLFKDTFLPNEEGLTDVTFYGEGYGAGIQGGGGKYRKDKSFIGFDIRIGNIWLLRKDVEEIFTKFLIDVVPIVGYGNLNSAIEFVRNGFKSTFGDFIAEGLVVRPEVELRTRRGDRIITKIKYKDFKDL